MPVLTIGGTPCYYRLTGPAEAPVLVVSHSLGQDHGLWDPQAADLSDHFRLLRYDIRGHGASGAPAGEYTIAQLGGDVLALADALGVDRFALCGLSLGGMIALWLATHAPERLTAIVLANTSARPDAARMEARRQMVLSHDMKSVADAVMERFFSPNRLKEAPPIVVGARRTLLATDPIGYAGCCAAVRDVNLVSGLPRISLPTLIVNGEGDSSLPWNGHGDVLAREISGARVLHLPTAHLSNLEAPRAFTAALFDFLLPPESDARHRGERIRRKVLGDAHVDRALASASTTSEAFQDLITRYAWGTVWARPALDIRTRRLLALALAAALGRWEEFRMHIRTGLEHGLEWRDIEEVLLHTSVYAGLPAANTGFAVAAEERLKKNG